MRRLSRLFVVTMACALGPGTVLATPAAAGQTDRPQFLAKAERTFSSQYRSHAGAAFLSFVVYEYDNPETAAAALGFARNAILADPSYDDSLTEAAVPAYGDERFVLTGEGTDAGDAPVLAAFLVVGHDRYLRIWLAIGELSTTPLADLVATADAVLDPQHLAFLVSRRKAVRVAEVAAGDDGGEALLAFLPTPEQLPHRPLYEEVAAEPATATAGPPSASRRFRKILYPDSDELVPSGASVFIFTVTDFDTPDRAMASQQTFADVLLRGWEATAPASLPAPGHGDGSVAYTGKGTSPEGNPTARALLIVRVGRVLHAWVASGIDGTEPLADLLMVADGLFADRAVSAAAAADVALRDLLPTAEQLPWQPIFTLDDETVTAAGS